MGLYTHVSCTLHSISLLETDSDATCWDQICKIKIDTNYIVPENVAMLVGTGTLTNLWKDLGSPQ